MTNRITILAGGLSSRMKHSIANSSLDSEQLSQANKRSKGLIEIGDSGKTLLDYLLLNIERAGYKKVFIITGEDSKLFRERYTSHSDLEIQFATQYIPKDRKKPLGTADAVYQTMRQFPELQKGLFSVCNSDNLYSEDALKALRASKIQACIAYDRDALEFSEEKIARFAVMQFDDENYLLDIIEKPNPSDIELYKDRKRKIRVSMNLFAFNGSLSYSYFKNCPIHPERNEKEIPSVITSMLSANSNSMIGIPFAEHVPDLTAKDDILKMINYIKNKYL